MTGEVFFSVAKVNEGLGCICSMCCHSCIVCLVEYYMCCCFDFLGFIVKVVNVLGCRCESEEPACAGMVV